MQGISGGERKRTCVGIEMISNPSVLVLDEPTSGLDSFTAAIILGMLTKIAKEGKTVIFTIHQPSSRLFGMLDRLIVLHRGDTIYQGESQGIVQYMDRLGIEVPAKYNISDFFMLELSDYKRKLAQKDTKLNETEYKQVCSTTDLDSPTNSRQGGCQDGRRSGLRLSVTGASSRHLLPNCKDL